MSTNPDGMRAVVAASSAITWIDGKAGLLRYRGYPIGDLAENCSFEAVAYLIWYGELPNGTQLEELQSELRSVRMGRGDLVEMLSAVPTEAHPLEVLRYLVSWDALINPLVWRIDESSNMEKSKQLVAWFPVAVAAFHRKRDGRAPVSPRQDLDTAGNLLYMLSGREPSGHEVRTLNMSLVLHADHEMNASTFAARVTIATQSNLHAAVASALGALSGPRHGGASERVVHMLEEIGRPENTADWVRDQLDRKQRVMGFGHAVYRTTDPRSRHLRVMAEGLLAGTPREPWIAILRELGAVMERDRGLFPNVDLYAAVVNHELGVDPAFYTSLFACSRIVGWTAHAMEQLDGRLIRPAAEYTGPGERRLAAAVPE